MTLMETIRKRYSCRAYKEKAIEQEKLDTILEAARLAPSARNMQDWRFLIVTETKNKRQVAECTNRPEVFEKAGVIIVACSNSDYVMRETEKVRSILGIPDDIIIVELMTVGYPADAKPEPKRESVEKIVCYEKWTF